MSVAVNAATCPHCQGVYWLRTEQVADTGLLIFQRSALWTCARCGAVIAFGFNEDVARPVVVQPGMKEGASCP